MNCNCYVQLLSTRYSCQGVTFVIETTIIFICVKTSTQPLKVIRGTDNSKISAEMPSEVCRKLLLVKESYGHSNWSADEYFNTLCLLLQLGSLCDTECICYPEKEKQRERNNEMLPQRQRNSAASCLNKSHRNLWPRVNTWQAHINKVSRMHALFVSRTC